MPTDTGVDSFDIAGKPIGPGRPVFVIGEISANHGGHMDHALTLIDHIADAGGDAAKIQTYRADTMTVDADTPWLRIGGGTPWDGQKLFDLYQSAGTPWEWTGALMARARERGIALFSTPFDASAVDHLEQFDVPVYKIASFELVDHDLLRTVAGTGRPVILSTGLATAEEIDDAVGILRDGGAPHIALLRCNSAYPAPAEEMDLRTIPDMMARWHLPVGLSDHTVGSSVAVAAVALGACIVEKHITISRDEPTADGSFSLEPHEFSSMVEQVRTAEAALGSVRYGPTDSEKASLAFRRSLFSLRHIPAGSVITVDDVGARRPGAGLPPRVLPDVLGKRARVDIPLGTPINWELLD